MPIRVLVVYLVYTCANMQTLHLAEKLSAPKECRNVIALKVVSTVIFLYGEYGNLLFVSEASCKFRPPSIRGTGVPPSRKSVMMYSAIRASYFAYEWIAKHVRSTRRPYLVLMSDKKESLLSRDMYFFSDCFWLAALPVIIMNSYEHRALENPRNHRRNSFTSMGSVRPSAWIQRFSLHQKVHEVVAVKFKSTSLCVYSCGQVQMKLKEEGKMGTKRYKKKEGKWNKVVLRTVESHWFDGMW